MTPTAVTNTSTYLSTVVEEYGPLALLRARPGQFELEIQNRRKGAEDGWVSWKELVDLATVIGISQDAELAAARARLLPTELSDFRGWLAPPGHEQSESHYEKFEEFKEKYRAGAAAERPLQVNAQSIVANKDRYELRCGRLSAEEVVELTILILADSRTYRMAGDQFSPFLVEARRQKNDVAGVTESSPDADRSPLANSGLTAPQSPAVAEAEEGSFSTADVSETRSNVENDANASSTVVEPSPEKLEVTPPSKPAEIARAVLPSLEGILEQDGWRGTSQESEEVVGGDDTFLEEVETSPILLAVPQVALVADVGREVAPLVLLLAEAAGMAEVNPKLASVASTALARMQEVGLIGPHFDRQDYKPEALVEALKRLPGVEERLSKIEDRLVNEDRILEGKRAALGAAQVATRYRLGRLADELENSTVRQQS